MSDQLSPDRQPGQVLAVDPDACTACGICYTDDENGELFEEMEDGRSKAKTIPPAKFDEDQELVDKAQDAIETCPAEAIGWTTPEEGDK